jgi:hypothetical protein
MLGSVCSHRCRRGVAAGFLAIVLLWPIPAHAQLVVEGSDADVATFNGYLEKCKGESPAFADLLRRIDESGKKVTAKVGRNQPGVVIDDFKGGGVQVIDVADLAKFPNPKKNPRTGNWEFPPGVPSWASTLCEQLAHALGEALHGAVTGEGYDHPFGSSHRTGFREQNRVRRDFGQPDDIKGDSKNGGHEGHLDMKNEYNGHTETWHLSKGSTPGQIGHDIEQITYEE